MANQDKRSIQFVTILLAILTVIFLLAVNTVGFIDTETGSGFACGNSWPLCEGVLIPQHMGIHKLIEFGHRALVPIATLLLLATSVFALIQYRKLREVVWLIVLAIASVFVQGALGALGVIFGDPAWFLAFHFGISLIAFASVLLLCILLFQLRRVPLQEILQGGRLRPDYSATGSRIRSLVWWSLIYIYVEMYFGAYISSSGAAPFFHGWPFPTESIYAPHYAFWMDCIHRLFALGLLVFSLFILRSAAALRNLRSDLYRAAWGTVILVLLQALSGILIVTYHNVSSFLIHVTLVAFLFSSLCLLALLTVPDRPRKKSVSTTL
ncbi:heme A synthase [Alicyclobacillus sp. TC]|uniref:COX15/CtaA family protein n=1 Tax=Alicyclobacillus sp. TC TaxID=2606450 RepID=UPI001934AD28|nr:COX15/CtaA family protein [Alicyclobacillus sp. TC]QRF24192.1 heme A synthase [Alicyclobacillus sp. TC]